MLLTGGIRRERTFQTRREQVTADAHSELKLGSTKMADALDENVLGAESKRAAEALVARSPGVQRLRVAFGRKARGLRPCRRISGNGPAARALRR